MQWLLLLLLAAVASAKFPDISARIVGGNVVENRNAYPQFVRFTIRGSSIPHCGGTMIHDDLVLTAAHCYYSGPLEAIAYAYSSTDNYYDSQQQVRTVERLVQHPQYTTSFVYDIMVVKLSSPVSPVSLARLNAYDSEPSVGEELTVIGMGMTQENGTPSDYLKEANVYAISHGECQDQYLGFTIDDETMFCAGVDGGGTDACAGDSGGPIFLPDGTQAGVVSFGLGCARASHFGVYARVDAAHDWIQEQICELSDVPPSSCGGGQSFAATTSPPTSSPTRRPTLRPTASPTLRPTLPPTERPTSPPTLRPTSPPTERPTSPPTERPTSPPTERPTSPPTPPPTSSPTEAPTQRPTLRPTVPPTASPTETPTSPPTASPTLSPTESQQPSVSGAPSEAPTASVEPTQVPTASPSASPSDMPSVSESPTLSSAPTTSIEPSNAPTPVPTTSPTTAPTGAPVATAAEPSNVITRPISDLSFACQDNGEATFQVEGELRNCAWLADASQDTRYQVCKENNAASTNCPVTCNRCTGDNIFQIKNLRVGHGRRD